MKSFLIATVLVVFSLHVVGCTHMRVGAGGTITEFSNAEDDINDALAFSDVSVDTGLGYQVRIGGRQDQVVAEAVFERSRADGSITNTSGFSFDFDGEVNLFGVFTKFLFLDPEENPFVPYALAGLGVALLTVDDGFEEDTGAAALGRFGLGAEFYNATGVVPFAEVWGQVSGEAELFDDFLGVDLAGFGATIGIAVEFGPSQLLREGN